MTSGTYTNYYNLMEIIRDQFVACGWTVNAFKVNTVGAATRGYRLHVSKAGVFIALAGSDVGQPDGSTASTWVANSIKGICFEITDTDRSNEALWYNVAARRQTCQVGENNSYFLFVKDNGFLLSCRFTPRKYSFFNFLRVTGYDITKTYQMATGSYTGSSPAYVAAWSGIAQFPFIGRSNVGVETTTGATGGTFIDVASKQVVSGIACNHFTNGASGFSNTSGNSMTYLGYGRPDIAYSNANSNIIHRTKTPFSEDYTPLPVEFFDSFTQGTENNKVALIHDMYVVYMKTYQAEQIKDIGQERFIILPFLEKSATDATTMYFGYNMGVAIKIGVI